MGLTRSLDSKEFLHAIAHFVKDSLLKLMDFNVAWLVDFSQVAFQIVADGSKGIDDDGYIWNLCMS